MWTKIFLIFFVFAFLFRSDQAFDQDLGRHIKLGEIITQNKNVPKVNLFSYTNPDFPFVNTHWLFGVIAYLFNQGLGLQAFVVLKVIIFITSVWLILKIVPKQNSALLLPIGFIFLHVLRERLELRPEIFSFLYTCLTYFILESFLKKPTKLIYLLPIIQLIWINTHIYFFVGLLIQLIFITHLVYLGLRSKVLGNKLKILAGVFTLSFILSLINPNGLNGLLYPLKVNQNYGYTIVENQTMFLLESINFHDPNFIFVKASLLLIIISLAFTFFKKEFVVKNILLSLAGLGLALLNVRSFPYLVFLSLPAVLQNFGSIKVNNLTKTIAFFTVGILLLESLFYISGEYYKSRDDSHEIGFKIEERVKGAMNFVINNNLENPIFNNFDIGSYIFYRGYPKYKVFVDGRPEAYPKEFFQDIYIPIQYDYAKFKEAKKTYGFKTIIFSHTDQTPWGKNFLQSVVLDKDWKIVYIDDFVMVLTLSNSKDMLPAIDLSKLSPENFNFTTHIEYLRLAYFLFLTKNDVAAKQFAQKALQIYPNSPSLKSFFSTL